MGVVVPLELLLLALLDELELLELELLLLELLAELELELVVPALVLLVLPELVPELEPLG